MLSELEGEGTNCSGDTYPKAENSDKLSGMAHNAHNLVAEPKKSLFLVFF